MLKVVSTAHNAQPELSFKDQLLVFRDSKTPISEETQLKLLTLMNRSSNRTPETLGIFVKLILRFRSPPAQLKIAQFVLQGLFKEGGKDVLINLAKRLPFLSAPDAENVLSLCFTQMARSFGNDEDVRTAIAGNLPCFNSVTAQRCLANSIYSNKLGLKDAGFEALAIALPRFTDSLAQRTLATAILDKRIGKTPGIPYFLSLEHTAFTDPTAQHIFATAVERGSLGDDAHTLELLIPFLRDFKFSLPDKTPFSKLKEPLQRQLFGSRVIFGEDLATWPLAAQHDSEDMLISLDPMARFIACECGTSEHPMMLVYSLSHDDRREPFPIPQGRDRSEQEDQRISDFKSWLSLSNPMVTQKYAHVLDGCKIFHIDNNVLYQKSIGDLTGKELYFSQLPHFFQTAFHSTHFHPDNFTHGALFGRVFSFLSHIPDTDLKDTLLKMVKGLIGLNGNDASFEADTLSTINAKLSVLDFPEIGRPSEALSEAGRACVQELNQALTSLKQEEVARLGYIMLHLSRAGALGFHVGSNNQSNPLLYSLAHHCFTHLASLPDSHVTFPETFLERFGNGECAQMLCSLFSTSNPGLELGKIYAPSTVMARLVG
jgi:hypothetical protein